VKALVTGVTGFIGGALAQALAEAGWQLSLLARPASAARLPAALGKALEAGQASLFEADLGDAEADLGPAVGGCDAVFHAAAIRDRWGTSPETYRRVNVEGTSRLLEASLGRAGRFVFVSSVGVYGRPGVLNVDESFPVQAGADATPYHRTKAQAEQAALARAGEIEVVVVRPTITYGPGDDNGAITRLAGMIARGGFVRVCPGSNHLHLTYIDDLVQGLLLAGAHPAAAGETFILSGQASITLEDLLAKIAAHLGRPPYRLALLEGLVRPLAWAVEQGYRSAGLRSTPPLTPQKIDTLCAHRSFSSAKAARLLGYAPGIGYDEGLAKTLAWMAEAGLLPVDLPRTALPGPSNPAEAA
jgi:nucleoside-diphosphate-sugar epimerase